MLKKRVHRLIGEISLEAFVIAMLFICSLFLFALITHEAVLEREDAFDNRVISFFSKHATPGLIQLMTDITFFGSHRFLLPAYIFLILYFAMKKKYAYVVDILIIAISSTALMFGLKEIFRRERPELPIIKGISNFSFPSGHALSSFIFCSILIYITWNSHMPRVWKFIFIVLLLLLSLVIGISRIVLNVHYTTDVIAGFALGLMWVILSFWVLHRIRRKKLPALAKSTP